MKLSLILHGLMASGAVHAFGSSSTDELSRREARARDIQFLGIQPTDSSKTANATLAARADLGCRASRHLFPKIDADDLKWGLQNQGNPDSLVYVPRQSHAAWYLGRAMVCVYNQYLTENTHLKQWEAGWAVGTVDDICCNVANNPDCDGGWCICHGDTGLNLVAKLRSIEDGC